MTTEQKAKAYDEALKVLHKYDGAHIMFTQDLKEEMFPELREESEDERIRKWLIEMVEEVRKANPTNAEHNGMCSEAKAWLEKQGEQKPADKVELKVFKIGDIITNGILVGKIDEIHEFGYHAYFGDHYADIPDIENWHLWTIQDANDGDILSYRNGQWIFIYKEKIDNNTFSYHTLYSTIHQDLTINDSGFTLLSDAIVPATKEQRDILFSKMKESGYEWDAEKKELRKINSYCEKHCKGYQETGKCFADSECKAKREAEQNPAWSEEDERIIDSLISICDEAQDDIPRLSARFSHVEALKKWLTSLKDRIQPQSTWSEEDEKIYQSIMDDSVQENQLNDKQTNWLRDIKYRYFPQPQPKWNEEDELHIKELESLVKRVWAIGEHENDKDTVHEMSDLSFFLKTLKPKLKQEWSEEDEKMLNDILMCGEHHCYLDAGNIAWLKSLRPQNKWKPSDEQMKALWEVYKGGENQASLASLYSDLRKLKE